MKVYFRVDASVHIGSGHVMRCLSLAEELQKQVNDVIFVMRPQAGDLCDYTENRGFKVKRLPKPLKVVIPKNTADYQAWLQVNLMVDVEDFLLVAADADLVIVDHYGIDAFWEEIVKIRTSCKLVAIDDLVRSHNADLIIDQTLSRKQNEYRAISDKSIVLSGEEYALLKNEFHTLRSSVKKKVMPNQNHKLLLTMGGTDNFNATLKVLEALSCRKKTIQTTVLLSNRAPHFNSVASFSKKNLSWLTHIPFSDNMAALMLEHTLAIGASGTTSWERACIGLPSIIIPLAENQLEICHNLVIKKAAISLSIDEINSTLNTKLDWLINRFISMRKNSLSICDGKGCKRVIQKMFMLGWL